MSDQDAAVSTNSRAVLAVAAEPLPLEEQAPADTLVSCQRLVVVRV